MSPRHFYRAYYPEEAKKMDQAYAEAGVIIVDTVTRAFKRFVIPFFVPGLRETNNTDKDNAKGIKE